MLNKKQIDSLAKYDFKLIIQKKDDPTYGDIIEMDGSKNIGNVFLPDTIIAIADGLIAGEEQFEDYKKRGVIVQGADGQYDLNNTSAQGLAGEGVVIDNNEFIERVEDKKDLKGGKID